MRSFLILISALHARRPAPRNDCSDYNLGELCHDACWDTYEACKDDCNDAGCERRCMSSYTDCFRSCPCYDFCPDGCENCDNSICTCKSPEIDNPHYRTCIREGTNKLDNCYKACSANSTCHETCLENMRVESTQCPCMEGCPLGCPCEGSYDCERYVTVMCQSTSQPSDKDFSYIISTNGRLQSPRYYTSPLTTDSSLPKGSQFLYKAGFSLLNGRVYIFGGEQDKQKIAVINECGIDELTSKRLNNPFDMEFGSLITVYETTDKVVLCQGTSKKCESFNAVESVNIADTREMHTSACMGLNRGQPTIIAGKNSNNGTTETFEISGWQYVAPHPAGDLEQHSCATVPNGIITIGGEIDDDVSDTPGNTRTVYLYRNAQWSIVGQMLMHHEHATVITFSNFFIVFGGQDGQDKVERVEWDGNKVVEDANEILNDHDAECYNPIVFETAPDKCQDFCSEDFCYDLGHPEIPLL